MAKVKDPVCGMMIEPGSAAGQATHQSQIYYFCSEQCRRQFEQNPDKFAGSAGSR